MGGLTRGIKPQTTIHAKPSTTIGGAGPPGIVHKNKRKEASTQEQNGKLSDAKKANLYYTVQSAQTKNCEIQKKGDSRHFGHQTVINTCCKLQCRPPSFCLKNYNIKKNNTFSVSSVLP